MNLSDTVYTRLSTDPTLTALVQDRIYPTTPQIDDVDNIAFTDQANTFTANQTFNGNLVFGGDTNNKPVLQLGGSTYISQYQGISIDIGSGNSWGQFNQTEGNSFGVWGKNNRHLVLKSNGGTYSVITRAQAGQTGNLHEFQDSTGTILLAVDKDGEIVTVHAPVGMSDGGATPILAA